MSITIFCKFCGTKYRLEDRHAGKRFTCRSCGNQLEAPGAPPPEAAPPPPQSFPVYCPGCSHITQATAALVGKKVRCKRCSQVFRVPGKDELGLSTIDEPQAAPRQPAETPRTRPAAPSPLSDLGSLLDEADRQVAIPMSPLEPAAATPRMTLPKFQRGFDDSSSNRDSSFWSTVSLVYGLIVLVLLGLGFATKPAVAMILPAVFLCLGIPNLTAYIIALIRMARYGNAGLAVLCLALTCCGVGELVALAISFSNKEKWRIEELLPIWLTLYILLIVCSFLGGCAGGFLPGVQAARDAAEKANANQQQQQPGGGAPATIGIEAIDLERQLLECDEQGLQLLKGLRDKVTAEQAQQRVSQFVAKENELMGRMPKMIQLSGEPGIKFRDLRDKREKLMEQVAAEMTRIAAIPGLAQALQNEFEKSTSKQHAAMVALQQSWASPRTPSSAPSRAGTEHPNAHELSPELARMHRPPPKDDEERVKYALDDIKSTNVFARREGAKALKSVQPNARRAEVARALEAIISDSDADPFTQKDALAALALWGTAANASAVVRLLNGDHVVPDTAKAAMNTLVALKDPKSAQAIVKQLFTFNAKAALQALKDMGPAAEDAVIAQLTNKDPEVRREMCVVLEEIGTSKSLIPLQTLTSDRGRGVKDAAKQAIAVIRESARTKSDNPLKRVPK